MNINVTTAKINSIFLAVVLVVGTFAAVYPSFIIGVNAQAERDYGYDNDRKDVSASSLKCNNINVNLNGIEANIGGAVDSEGAAAAPASTQGNEQSSASLAGNDERNNNWVKKFVDKDFGVICISNNNNNNILAGEEEELPTPPISCEDCFEEFALTEELLTSIAGLEDPIIPLIASQSLDLTGVTDIESLCNAFLEASLELPPAVASQLFNQLLPGLTALEQIEVEELITCLFNTGTIIRGEF